ncbi:hypothetical protein Goarm_022753 [Gossypium armourianum]|uniref:CCHC-type domain-containing protein n=1 Tax=Gossypium armourianum TaxID=34283 RepID=A0A7J9KGF4_9ROSI|nr:hypothetical protein [Gossypium armourianum]
MVNGELQRVEYQVLPTICFSCGKYGHLKEQCTSPAAEKISVSREVSGNTELVDSTLGGGGIGVWSVDGGGAEISEGTEGFTKSEGRKSRKSKIGFKIFENQAEKVNGDGLIKEVVEDLGLHFVGLGTKDLANRQVNKGGPRESVAGILFVGSWSTKDQYFDAEGFPVGLQEQRAKTIS